MVDGDNFVGTKSEFYHVNITWLVTCDGFIWKYIFICIIYIYCLSICHDVLLNIYLYIALSNKVNLRGFKLEVIWNHMDFQPFTASSVKGATADSFQTASHNPSHVTGRALQIFAGS